MRFLIVAFVILTVIYAALSLWSRHVRRGKLREAWIEDGRVGDRDAYVQAGLRDYDGSLRRRLILLVYVVPMAAVAAIVYLVNYT